jgi:hypothetical protein
MSTGLFGDGSCFTQPPATNGVAYEPSDAIDRFIHLAIEHEAQARRNEEHAAECREIVELTCAQEIVDLAAKSPRTRNNYLAEWKAFVADCQTWGCTALPASPAVVAAYLLEMVGGGLGYQKVAKARAAIGYAHSLKENLVDPTDHILVRAVLRKAGKQSGNGKANGFDHEAEEDANGKDSH